jgi:Bacteriophage related domain of unknown function
MAKFNAITACLDTYLAATSGIPAIKWSNVEYNPDTGTSFLAVENIFTSRKPASMGLNQQKRTQGIYSIYIYTPENLGPGAGTTLADILITAFDVNTAITQSGTTVSVEYSEVGKSFETSPFYCTPVTIAWYAYTD